MTDKVFVEKIEEGIETEPVVEHETEVVVENEVKEEVKKEATTEPVVVKGIVTDCEKLYVRRGAIVSSDVKGIINKDDIVEINEKRSTEEWYRVRTEGGLHGFCMKKYITKLP